MKFSIIVPVYNVEKYLDRCVNSLIKSIYSLNNCEILLIDDGSTDSSSNIIDRYSNDYSYIKSFHKTNGGLSDARNYGLAMAKGEYVIFIDSDDEVNVKLFKDILMKMNDYHHDILLWDATIIDEKSKKIVSSLNYYYIHNGLDVNKIYSGTEVIDYQLSYSSDFVTTVWLGAYKKSFLLDNQLFFEKGLFHEDELWTIKVLLSSNKVCYLNSKAYLYRQRENSIMNRVDKDYSKNLHDIIFIYSSLYSYINWKLGSTSLAKKIKGNITKRYLHSIGRFYSSKSKDEVRRIDVKQIYNNSLRLVDKCRCILLKISPYLYSKISKK